jgi:hypothetical protein
MAKTRKQTCSLQIKEEDSERQSKNTQQLHGVRNTTKNKSKISKTKASRQENEPMPTCSGIKLEEVTENKFLLQAQPFFVGHTMTEKKIRQLISYVKDDKMTVLAASQKLKIGYNMARKIYNTFLLDPNRKEYVTTERNKTYTQQQINMLIEYIVGEGLSVENASLRVNMPAHIGYVYHKEYCGDPNHNIPIPNHLRPLNRAICTQDQITKLIGYIVDDNMTLAKASLKAQMSIKTGRRYYTRYLNDLQHKIPVPRVKFGTAPEMCTQEKVKKLIGYIIDDKIPVVLAATKAKMSESSARKYYLQYMSDPKREIPIPRKPREFGGNSCTQEQITKLIGHLVNDNMSIRVAAVKVNMCDTSAKKYYTQYLEDPNHEIPAPKTTGSPASTRITQDQITEVIGYIVNDKMSIKKAALKTNIKPCAARKYYLQYMNDPNHAIPVPYHTLGRSSKICTQEQIDLLIGFMVNDNMSIERAAIKANMSRCFGEKYYRLYLKDPEHKIPAPQNHYSTSEQIETMISYVVNDKLPVNRAAKLVNMGSTTAHRYYKRYLAQK